MTRRVALYLRVSTTGQTVDNQRRDLLAVAERAGWVVVGEYADEGISGSHGRDRRPRFDAMLKAATRREFDMLAAWSVDRLGRSLQDLVGMLAELRGNGVGLYLHQQALDTSTPAGEAMFGMIGVFAQFERAMIRERVAAGLARARAAGRVGGRPRVAAAQVEAVRAALAGGASVRGAARAAGVSVGVAHRASLAPLKEAESSQVRETMRRWLLETIPGAGWMGCDPTTNRVRL